MRELEKFNDNLSNKRHNQVVHSTCIARLIFVHEQYLYILQWGHREKTNIRIRHGAISEV